MEGTRDVSTNDRGESPRCCSGADRGAPGVLAFDVSRSAWREVSGVIWSQSLPGVSRDETESVTEPRQMIRVVRRGAVGGDRRGLWAEFVGECPGYWSETRDDEGNPDLRALFGVIRIHWARDVGNPPGYPIA